MNKTKLSKIDILIWRIGSYFRVKISLWKFQRYINKRVSELPE